MLTLRGLGRTHVVAAMFLLCACALGQDKVEVKFEGLATTVQRDPGGQGHEFSSWTLNLRFTLADLPTGQRGDDMLAALKQYLGTASPYSFVNDWPGAENLSDTSSDNPPFTLQEVGPIEPVPGGSLRIRLLGQMRPATFGEVRIASPGAMPYGQGAHAGTVRWVFKGAFKNGGSVAVRYGNRSTVATLDRFRLKTQFTVGQGGATLDVSGSGLIGGDPGQHRGTLTTLGVAGKLPLGTPQDVREGGGSSNDASGEVPNTVELSVNRYSYSRGLDRLGLKFRSTSEFAGFEAVGYYSPLTVWGDGGRAFGGAEVEIGFRDGNAEWENLTTRAPDRGRFVGRLGFVAEWAPRLGVVNKNLREGVRFFARARGWADSYKAEGSGGTTFRFRQFFDSELFYNFTSDWRLFGRYEAGYLPPNLSRRLERISLGIGRAF